MEPRMPLPTDNIYKFYAIFGLVLLLTTFYLFINIHNSYNERAIDRYVEIETLREIPQPTLGQDLRKSILEAQETLDISDKKFYQMTIAVFIVLSLSLITYGFFHWQTKIQPLQDSLLHKQIKKLELEIDVLVSDQKKNLKTTSEVIDRNL